jgi:RNA polymerase sigma-70 factor (ECF subfamily)
VAVASNVSIVPAMSATFPTEARPYESTAGTLGVLLFTGKSRTPVPEKEWEDLLHAIAAGDQSALHALYERAHRIVFTLIVRICKSRETAEELTLDVFHDVWRRAASYDSNGGSVVGWIMNQARSRAIDRLRFEQRKKRVDPHADRPLVEEVASDCAELLGLDEQRVRVRVALEILTLEERRAIEAAFFSGLSYAEVAQMHDQPLGTVKTRIRSGLGKLRQVLASDEGKS